ncbi:MAG: hypothetical protein KCHDKBKB_01629 [Elusimicrobia bacterium]|nr:hypothetical protein [Elusimicrobiota bacterium]
MNSQQARALVTDTFPQPFDKGRFRQFAVNLLNHIDESKAQAWNTTYVKDAFKDHVKGYERLGTYTSPDDEKLDVLIVHLTAESKLGRARTAIRNFVADHLKTRDSKEAALVAFVSPTEKQWRFSYVKMEYAAVAQDDGKVGVKTKLTPARRSSYIVGEGESCHTAQTRFLDLLQDTENHPMLAQIEDAFSVEAVTKEFFEQYKALFLDLADEIEVLMKRDKTIRDEFASKNVSTADFAKKLMGQIVFLYFLQKKGWLGVSKGCDWGDGPHNFLRHLLDGKFGPHKNFFNDILEPLFYDTLATDRGHDAWCKTLNCRIPFLNGGLFEPLAGYDWQKTDIAIPNSLFANTKTTKAGDIGTGILDVFDRYNFTVNEAEPLEKEVAIDPEMLGKVFENLLGVKERKSKGSFYTPREIVHYMCQESLINYIDTAVNTEQIIPRTDIETFIRSGDQASHYEAARVEGTGYARKLPKTIETHSRLLDDKLADITVCDPAIGSGAFPVGMMQEIVRARSTLTPYFNDVHERTSYHFKRHAIQNCLYGVDIDPGAVEIAKLRLWLSLVVDEDDVKQIKPLPNLDYKIVAGNSLLCVEKNLFNVELFNKLEELKPRYFDATDRKQKEKFKHEIDDLILELTNGKEIFDFEIYFSEVFHRKNGFDVIIANPPYITLALGKKQNHLTKKDIELLTPLYSDVIEYKGNTFILFLRRAYEIVANKKVCTFIIPNTLLLNDTCEKMRKFLLSKTSLVTLVNIHGRVFESAEIGGNLICIFKRSAEEENKVQIHEVADLEKFATLKPSLIPQLQFASNEGCRFYTDAIGANIIKKIRDNSTSLGELAGFYNGIKTGDNKKYLSDRKINSKYREIIRGRDVDRYQIVFNNKFVLFDKQLLWSNSDETKLGRKPKIIIRQTGDSLIAALDEVGRFSMDTTHLIFDTKIDIQYLLGLLNSNLMNWIHRKLTNEENRAFAEVKIVNLKRLPIKIATGADQKSVISLVNHILTVKQRNADTDTTPSEREIDGLVYKLYGLTKEDIAIVEESRS